MTTRILPALAIGAAVLALAPAAATDTSSLSAFLRSCSDDAKSCHLKLSDVVQSARNAKYGCIPAAISASDAADKLLEWMKTTASANPKYEKEPLSDRRILALQEVTRTL